MWLLGIILLVLCSCDRQRVACVLDMEPELISCVCEEEKIEIVNLKSDLDIVWKSVEHLVMSRVRLDQELMKAKEQVCEKKKKKK